MTETEWRPLSRRAAGLPVAGPVEGVPGFLYGPLQGWLWRVLQYTDLPPQALASTQDYSPATREVMLRIQTDTQPWLLPGGEGPFLDAVDATLRWRLFHGNDRENPTTLQRILSSANSIWRVSDEFLGLERRIDATVTASVGESIQSANQNAGDFLRTAWENTYGLEPEPDTAYREAVRAVEEAAAAVVLPKSPTPSLGTVRDHLRDANGKWELVLPDRDGNPAPVGVVVEMLTVLERGQRSRHGGGPNSRRQTQAEAEAAVHLAATLVMWLSTGVLRRRAGSGNS